MPEAAAGEKVLPPSQRKIEQARERGQVAKSQDLSAAVMLLVGLLTLVILGPDAMRQIAIVTRYFLGGAAVAAASEQELLRLSVYQAVYAVTPTFIPILLILMVSGIVINLLQFGVIFSGQALTPKLERINPITGFQRFFTLRILVELFKSIFKLVFVGLVVWFTLLGMSEELLSLSNASLEGVGLEIWSMMITIWWRIGLAILVIGLLDFAFQRWQYMQDLRMTQQEAREELRQLEGDPRIKQRVRTIQRQMTMQRMMRDVPEADVIITNPTRFAVAIRYDVDNMDAPTVVAKGARIQAERIRDIALEHDVPIVERPDLARTLYRTIEIGQTIPENLFRAVAEVLAYVYQIDRRESKIRERQTMQPAIA